MTVCGVFCKESPCADNAAFSKTQRHTEKILYLLSTSVSGTFASLKLNQLNRVVRQRAKPQTTRSTRDRKSTRLHSSHTVISYAVLCLNKKLPSAQPPTRPGA